VGLDAQVAHEFAVTGMRAPRLPALHRNRLAEVVFIPAGDYEIVADGVRWQTRALVVALANGRQYGNGAVIAPDARIDDGRLEVIVIGDRSALRALTQMPALFSGRIAQVPGITMTAAQEVSISSEAPMIYHADGEPCLGGTSIRARIRPKALRLRVPRSVRLGR
jgi:diacylglycerol kinase family enzyme